MIDNMIKQKKMEIMKRRKRIKIIIIVIKVATFKLLINETTMVITVVLTVMLAHLLVFNL